MDIKQGDIYWVKIPQAHTVGSEQFKTRPYIIVSRLGVNKALKTVVGVPLSTKIEKANSFRIAIPVGEIIVDPSCTYQVKDSVALADHIREIDKSRLQERIGHLSASATIAVGLGIAFLLDIR